jgi:YVTN family beta-propeller protein
VAVSQQGISQQGKRMKLNTRAGLAGAIAGAALAAGLSLAAIPGAADAAPAVTGARTISLPEFQVSGVAVDAATDTAYVSGYVPGSLSNPGFIKVIDLASGVVTAKILVGRDPRAVAVDQATDTVYVANQGDSTITAIDGATSGVIATIPVTAQSAPAVIFGLAVDAATDMVYAQVTPGAVWNDVAVIDGATNTETATIDNRCSAQHGGIGYDSVTGDIYATLTGNTSCDGIQVISGTAQTGTLDQAKVDNKVFALATAIDPKAGTIYLGGDNAPATAGAVAAVNATTGAIGRVTTVGGQVFALGVNTATHTVFALSLDDPAAPGSDASIDLLPENGGSVAGVLYEPDYNGYLAVDSATDTVIYASTVNGLKSSVIVIPLESPAITTHAKATFTAGKSGKFVVTAKGTPTPRLTEKGKLPAGVKFTAGKNGTATIAGKPAHSAKGKTYVITLTAANGVGKAVTQKFTLKVS